MSQLEGLTLAESYLFEVEGGKFLYDINRMMILEVDDAIWDYCIAAGNGAASPRNEVAGLHGDDVADAVVEDLKQAGLLVAKDQSRAAPGPQPPTGFSGVTLHVTHGCNLKCTYCFAKQGDYGLGHSLMKEGTAHKAVDWLAEHADGEQSARITFFGGEPMMNMRAVSDTVEYANEKFARSGTDVRYNMTTNGTLLNDKNVKTLAQTKNIDIQVSLDGGPGVNDQFRVFANGRGSYDLVARGIERLKKATGKVILRGTIPPGAPEFGESLRHFIEDLGGTTVAFEPMSGTTLDGKTLDEGDVEAIKAEWEIVAEYFIAHAKNGEIKPVSQLVRLLTQLHKRKKTVYGCTAGWSHVAVDPGGDIYPCHRFVGEAQWKMGNVHEETLDESIREKFAQNTVDQREPCKSCWVRYTCGGHCAHHAKEATGTISDPDPVRCDLMRHMTDLALKTYVRVAPYRDKIAEQSSKAI